LRIIDNLSRRQNGGGMEIKMKKTGPPAEKNKAYDQTDFSRPAETKSN